ncbi:hypothetical protein [Bacillus alkalicellulosilyticus]|uniref:hypothetical protein n=1 Tax=Alkalihalobacterium alkalicellulosilyticum TaxID=1912214 RepID=UPI000997A5DF|nr:hypothetical protein [Bacillus alkalicellulosilyticus]
MVRSLLFLMLVVSLIGVTACSSTEEGTTAPVDIESNDAQPESESSGDSSSEDDVRMVEFEEKLIDLDDRFSDLLSFYQSSYLVSPSAYTLQHSEITLNDFADPASSTHPEKRFHLISYAYSGDERVDHYSISVQDGTEWFEKNANDSISKPIEGTGAYYYAGDVIWGKEGRSYRFSNRVPENEADLATLFLEQIPTQGEMDSVFERFSSSVLPTYLPKEAFIQSIHVEREYSPVNFSTGMRLRYTIPLTETNYLIITEFTEYGPQPPNYSIFEDTETVSVGDTEVVFRTYESSMQVFFEQDDWTYRISYDPVLSDGRNVMQEDIVKMIESMIH